jgi:nitric oxide synthase-interacting protein
MARHSRNNTANSVFTYAEKRMLDKDYGVRKSRIGQDSQRDFNQCHLCLGVVKDPVSCLQGHIFCKDCIMNNMLEQKKNIQSNLQQFQAEKDKEELKECLRKRKIEEIQTVEFEKDTFELGGLQKIKAHQRDFSIRSKFDEEDYERLERENVIAQIKNKKTLGFDNHEMKKDLIQTSFWMAESDKERLQQLDQTKKPLEDKKPKEKMTCPGDNVHSIKLKEFVPLKFEGDTFVCYASRKQLKFQKMVGLRTCGHVFIKESFDKCVKESAVCLCGKKFLEGDVFPVQPANSAFCEHNQVEAKIYEPAFAV